VKWFIDTGFEISLVTEHLHANLESQGIGMLEVKVQSAVLVTVFGSSSLRLKKQVYIPLYNDDNCLEHVFLVSAQMLESLLIGADFLQECGLVVNLKKINCLMCEIEGNTKKCKITYKVEGILR
jgi:hypothetical protein